MATIPDFASSFLFQSRFRGRTLFLAVCLLLIALPPAVAFAWTNFNYATGFNGASGSFATPGFAPREYNRVWHAQGWEWKIWYAHPNGSVNCFRDNTANPTACGSPSDPVHDSYAQSFCQNWNDLSGVQWTCQTTQP
jgi:hypothetical protein